MLTCFKIFWESSKFLRNVANLQDNVINNYMVLLSFV